MQGDTPQHGYDLLADLRRLETRIARLQKRWETFRADPRPEQLEEFRAAFSGTDRALAELASRLGGAGVEAGGGDEGRGGERGRGTSDETTREPGTAPGPSPSATPFGPDARSVVEAGRTLDQALAEIGRAWGFLRRDPDPHGLGGLAERLARAEAAASLLGRALPRSEREEEAQERSGQAAPAAGSLDGLLSRIREDWQSLRREPAPDRAGVLREELAEARRMTEGLRARLSASAPDAGTARYLTGMNDVVRFAPYRDAFTGLYNREGFDTLAAAELKRCRRYSRSFGLLVLETQATDLAELRGTIGTLQALLRGYDLVSRYSDRRLVVGLPETGGAETRRIAARLLRALEGEGRHRPVRRLAYALMPEDGVTLSALLEEAERRLEA